MPRKRKPPDYILEVPKNATKRQIYAAARRAFSAADLQKFTELDEGIPMEHVLADLEEINKRESKRQKNR
jgi:hypothetical protein